METKKVHVYITTYNRIEYFKLAIESILNQSISNFDLTILDNCSNDGTEQYVYSLNDTRIKYIRHSKNIGGIGNISYAFNHCGDSEYFVVVHDDDVLHKDFLAKELAYMENNKDCVAVSSLANTIDGDGKLIYIAKNWEKKYTFHGQEFFTEYLHNQSNLIFPATLYRTNFIIENRIDISSKPGPCADIVLYMDIEKCGGTIAIIPETLIDYRVYKNQDSSSHLEEMLIELMRYLSNDVYYGKLLCEDLVGRKKYFGWYLRRLIAREASECIKYQNANQYLEEMNVALGNPYRNVRAYTLVLKILDMFPYFAQFIYRIVKKVKV